MSRIFVVTRRDFLKATGFASGALILGCRGDGGAAPAGPFSPSLWVTLDADGTVSIVCHRSEMGQGIRTGTPVVLADEMGADWNRVQLLQADGDSRYGDQNTDGSRSVCGFFTPMREAGATARHMLVAAAAAHWGVAPEECDARDHRVIHEPSGKEIPFGELASEAARQPVPEPAMLRLKPRSKWRYIGKTLPLADGHDFVAGKAIYGFDVTLPDMLYAVIARPPALGDRVKLYDGDAARAVPGVEAVIKMPAPSLPPAFQPLGGVAVVARNTWAALRGRENLALTWEPGPHSGYDSREYRKKLEETARRPCAVVRQQGDVDAALAGASRRVEATYYAPHLAHVPMEPPAAAARFSDGKLEVWASTQDPQAAQGTLAQILGLQPEDVTVHVTFLGGAFGRKSKPDFIVEAAILARETGRPVRVMWTREDDVQHDFYHSVACLHLQAGLDGSGRPKAWLQRTVFPSIGSTFSAEARRGGSDELMLGFTDVPYDIPNLRCECGEAEGHARIGWLRSVANIYHAFGICSFADELAAAAGADPRDYLLQLIGSPRRVQLGEGVEYANYGESMETYPIDTGRLRGVIETVCEEGGWGRKLPGGWGMGLAAHRSFVSYVAALVVVSVDQRGRVKVEEAHGALDCGTFVNRDRVEAQVEGSLVFGLSLGLTGEITMKNGATEQGNFHDYPILRLDATPRILRAYLVESDAPPSGVGEPVVPPVAPALCNAIHAATGKRIRELPVSRSMRVWGT